MAAAVWRVPGGSGSIWLVSGGNSSSAGSVVAAAGWDDRDFSCFADRAWLDKIGKDFLWSL